MSGLRRAMRHPDRAGDPHVRARALASDSLLEQIPPADAAWLTGHLERCAGCRQYAAEIAADQQMFAGLRELTPAAPRDLGARLAAGLDQEVRTALQVRARAGRRGPAAGDPASGRRQRVHVAIAEERSRALRARSDAQARRRGRPGTTVSGARPSVVFGGLVAAVLGALLVLPLLGDQPGSGPVQVPGGSPGIAAVPGPTPMQVGAGPVAFVQRDADGRYTLAEAAVDTVCPGTSLEPCGAPAGTARAIVTLDIEDPSSVLLASDGQVAVVVGRDGIFAVSMPGRADPTNGAAGSATPQPRTSPASSPAETGVPASPPAGTPAPSGSAPPTPPVETPAPTAPAATPPAATPPAATPPAASASPSPLPSPSAPVAATLDPSASPAATQSPAATESPAPSGEPSPSPPQPTPGDPTTAPPVESPTPDAGTASPPATPDSSPANSRVPASPGPEATPEVTIPPATPAPTAARTLAIAEGVVVMGAAAAYSPDGQWVAFSARPSDGSGGPNVYAWRVGTTRAVALTDDGVSQFGGWVDGRVVVSRAIADGRPAPREAAASSVSAATSLVDPATGAGRALRGRAWRPVVDPTRAFAAYWDGDFTWSGSARTWMPHRGRLVIGRWDAVEDGSDQASEVPLSTGMPDGADWAVRWSPAGDRLAVWIADDSAGPGGRLSLFLVQPDGTLDSTPVLDAPALASFSLNGDRLAWATPPGSGGQGSKLSVYAWTATGDGQAIGDPDPDGSVLIAP